MRTPRRRYGHARRAGMQGLAWSSYIRLWKYNRVTGLWDYQRTVTPETADQWLAIFTRNAPRETFVLSRKMPGKR